MRLHTERLGRAVLKIYWPSVILSINNRPPFSRRQVKRAVRK